MIKNPGYGLDDLFFETPTLVARHLLGRSKRTKYDFKLVKSNLDTEIQGETI